MSATMNRAARRAHMQQRRQSFVPTKRREKIYPGPIWDGRCRCNATADRCQRKYPAAYLEKHRIETGEQLISFECWQNYNAPPEPKQKTHHESTTDSASAVGIEKLHALYDAGCAIDLKEAELESEDLADLRREVVLQNSLIRHLAAQSDLNDVERAAKLRRFRDLLAMFAGNDLRLAQWLAREYPGWVRA